MAVIGASRNPQKIGSRILTALKTGAYPGGVHVVHPTADSLQGVAAVRSARELPSYMFPENAVRALGKIAAYAAWRTKPEGQLRLAS